MTIRDDIKHDLRSIHIPHWARGIAPFYRAWMMLALILGWFAFRFLLIIVYVILIVPISLILRLGRKDLLKLDFSKKEASYWIEVERSDAARGRYAKKF